MGQLQKIESQLLDLGYQIIAISPDRPEKLVPTEERNSLNYTLLSDSQAEAARAFGVGFRVGDDNRRFQKALENASGADHHILPVPAVFLIGKDRKILFEYVNPDYRIRLQPEILLAAAQAYAK